MGKWGLLREFLEGRWPGEVSQSWMLRLVYSLGKRGLLWESFERCLAVDALSLNPLRANEYCNLLHSFFPLSRLPSPSLTTEYWSQKGIQIWGERVKWQGPCRTDQKLKWRHFGKMEGEESRGERLICPFLPYGHSWPLRFSQWLYDLGPPPGMRGGIVYFS